MLYCRKIYILFKVLPIRSGRCNCVASVTEGLAAHSDRHNLLGHSISYTRLTSYMIDYTIPSFDIPTVEKCLKNLKPSTAPGIASFIISKCYHSLAPVLTNIYNTSLSSGIFPRLWKSSWMVPIFKKWDRSCASNCRGITSLCAVSKAFELLLYGSMLSAT